MKNISGQSLFEVVVALAVISVVIVGLINVTTISIRNTSFSRNNTSATRLAQEATEWLRGERDAGWTTFITNAHNSSVYCLNSLIWNSGNCLTNETIQGNFYRQVSFLCYINSPPTPPTLPPACNTIGVNIVEANVSVVWTDAQGSHTVSTPTQLTKWKGN